jgi:HPt (histidine-containing phosphotransfer) domain-containing protein
LDKNSFELAQIIGHRLKGHGETFGFPQISAIGIKMEEAAIERNTGMLREAVMSLDESIEESFKKISQM